MKNKRTKKKKKKEVGTKINKKGSAEVIFWFFQKVKL